MKIGRYDVLDEIGHGAMGTVYRARDPLIERNVAIKTVDIAQLRQEGADAESRFLREAQSAGRLSHPNIVTIYDIGESGDLAYIAMEHLHGTTLRSLIDKGPMPIDLVLDTLTQMAEALAFAHEHGVIHRDIKPANVIVTGKNGRIKLTDFGIAHLTNSDHTHAGQMLGSPRYMSPEQAMGKEIDGRSDIFSLGAVLYEMLTAQYAFDGDSLPTILYRVINEMPVPATTLRPELKQNLAHLLARMLSKTPDARPDARELLQAIRELDTPQPALLPPSSTNRVPRILPLLAFGTPLGVFLLIGVSLIVIEHFIDEPQTAPTAEITPSNTNTTLPTPEPSADSPGKRKPDDTARQADPIQADPYLAGLDSKRVELRIKRTELLLEYTAKHPDVVQIDRQLDQLSTERRRYLRQLQSRQKN